MMKRSMPFPPQNLGTLNAQPSALNPPDDEEIYAVPPPKTFKPKPSKPLTHLMLKRSMPFSLAMWRTAGVARGFPSAPRKCEVARGVGLWDPSLRAGSGFDGGGGGGVVFTTAGGSRGGGMVASATPFAIGEGFVPASCSIRISIRGLPTRAIPPVLSGAIGSMSASAKKTTLLQFWGFPRAWRFRRACCCCLRPRVSPQLSNRLRENDPTCTADRDRDRGRNEKRMLEREIHGRS
jgi:hypothetical protein